MKSGILPNNNYSAIWAAWVRMQQDQPWVTDYVEKMMKDRKYVEDAYNRIQTQKIFEWAETKVNPTDKEISAEEFTKMVEAHQHHHH